MTLESPAPARVDLLVKGSELLVTMAGDEIGGGWVAVTDGKVAATGAPGSEPDATRTLDASGCLVTPGLVNAHHHMYQNLTRSYGPAVNKAPEEWWPICAELWKRIDEEASYVSSWIGLAELALGGCTTTADHLYVHPRPRLIDAQVAAARELGLRFHPVRGAMDMGEQAGGALPDVLVQDRDAILEDCERLVGSYHDRSPEAMVRVALGPCTTFDSSLDLFRASAELAERLDIRLHTHLAELVSEERNTLEAYGKRPLDVFEDVGWASSRTWVAHCIYVNQDEIGRLGRWGTGVAHCPSTNMLCCEGIAPIPELRAADVPVGLACDGSGYTDHGSLWLEARTALLLTKLRLGATAMTARDVLEIATVGSAACLGREGELGVLAPGAGGDLVVWPLTGVAFAGAWSDPVEAWLRCGPVAARHTVVAGEVVVRDGELTRGGLEEKLRQHARISRSWQLVADRP
jgi:cytosine/adenosine deaminase-related metal-dependent hydrolase